MIWHRIREYASAEDVNHIATSWQIATDEDFEDILVEELEATNSILFYFHPIEVPEDVSYYIRYKRHFDQENKKTDWSKPREVKNYTYSYDNMMLSEDIEINQPTIKVDKNEILSTDTYFYMYTSTFKSNVDQHASTHWFVLDSTDKVLFASVADTTNKTSIKVYNDPSYRNKTELKFMAIHVGATGMESKPGYKKTKMSTSSSFSFEISSSITGVAPLENLTIQFIKINGATSLNIISLELVDYNTEETILELDIDSDDCAYVPWYLLKENMKYKLKITAYDTSYQSAVLYKSLTVADFTQYVIRDQDKVYAKAITTFTSTLSLPNNIHTEECFNQTVLFPDADNLNMKVYKFNTTTSRLEDNETTADGIKLLSSWTDYMLIRPLSKALILIDQYNESKYPTFTLYSYDNNSDTYTLLQSKTRYDEEYPVGKNISFLQISSEEFLYMPYNQKVVRIYNYVDDTITDVEIDLDTIEDDVITAGTATTDQEEDTSDGIVKYVAARNRHNRVFIFNASINNAAIYNYVNQDITTGYNFGPVNFVNKYLKTIPLVDGSTLVIYESAYVKTQEEEEDATWVDYGDMQHYNYSTGDMECLYTNFSGSYPKSTALMNNGVLLLYNNDSSNTYFYMYT